MLGEELTAETLRALLAYNPETGEFQWRTRPVRANSARQDKVWNARYAGRRAGCRRRVRNSELHYRCIRVFDRLYQAHRLAWLYMSGAWPEHHIDHIDGNGENNAWVNLRQSTNAQNLWNRGAQANNTTGYKGVVKDRRRGRFYAQLRSGGKNIFLGSYETAQEAYTAYCLAVTDRHGEFAHSSAREALASLGGEG